jgi:flagellin
MRPARHSAAQAELRKKAATESLEAARAVAYWSITAEIEPDGLVNALGDALAEATQTLAISKAAIDAVVATLDSMTDLLTEAGRPWADIAAIQGAVADLGRQIREIVAGAAFQGFNLLDGSRDAAPLRFVSGFDDAADPAFFNTVPFQTIAIYGAGAGLLVREGADMTAIELDSPESAAAALSAVKAASDEVSRYSKRIKEAQDRIESASIAESSKDAGEPIGSQSEADETAMRLQALETKKQLGAHRLPIANQNSHFSLALPRPSSGPASPPLVLKP